MSSVKRYHALGRLPQGVMNKTEAEYERILQLKKRKGDILWYKFEGIKFRLADKTFYTPDFAVMNFDGEIEIHEVKGYWKDDAKVKIKVASGMYPFRFFAVYKIAKKRGGGFKYEEY